MSSPAPQNNVSAYPLTFADTSILAVFPFANEQNLIDIEAVAVVPAFRALLDRFNTFIAKAPEQS